MGKIHTLPVKDTTTTRKVNVRLMEENMTLKTQVAEQLKLIESMRARKTKAHRRLKALRELNKHVNMLHAENMALRGWNEVLRNRLLTKTTTFPQEFVRRNIFRRILGF